MKKKVLTSFIIISLAFIQCYKNQNKYSNNEIIEESRKSKIDTLILVSLIDDYDKDKKKDTLKVLLLIQ